jgi:glycosyltransferase involved in cell wall biosynthesis
MRIGLVAPPWATVPPHGYGGTEAVVDNLARGLAARGHEVRLFTVGDSTCPVRRDHHYPHVAVPMGQSGPEAAHVLAAYDALADEDVIHDHTLLGGLVARAGMPHCPPVVVTNHGPFSADARRIFARVAGWAAVVAISADQAESAGEIPIAAVIHHGIDLAAYRPGSEVGEHLVFIGRMCPDKGVERAVRIARAAGRPLRIVAKMREPDEVAYFETRVRPLLSGDDEVVGELEVPDRLAILQRSVALLNPILWPEPFGLVMAEALAAGTPVVAFDAGAAREIVTPGVTGFLCDDEAGAVAAVGRLGEIDRARCRADAEARFSIERMAADHERLYGSVLARSLTTRATSSGGPHHGVPARGALRTPAAPR